MADWEASDGKTTYSFTNEEFRSAFNSRSFYEELLGIIKESDTLLKQIIQIIDQPSLDPVARKAEIEHELDIIRGRISTPYGYKIDPLRIKKLMIELKQLT